MAIDTANRRASTIGSGLDFLTVWPGPDVEIDAGDLIQSAGLYRGIAAALAVYTPILVVTMPQSFPGYASVARNRSGVDPRSSTIRDRDHEHAEV